MYLTLNQYAYFDLNIFKSIFDLFIHFNYNKIFRYIKEAVYGKKRTVP